MSESIEELRQRWEEDPSPQLSLQLAEEYLRLEQREEAAGVLASALEENPEHVAARVALGRFRLELGELEESCALLERVVNEDPTHLVASKLLVRLYLQRGDKKQARDRLDLYKLLNASDPEIESLEAQLEGGSLTTVAVPLGVIDVPRNGDPFQDLWSDIDSAAYWQAFGAEGIFPVFGRPLLVRRASAAAPVEVQQQAPVTTATTVTLANLYLQQGHLDDAEKAFDEILERHPADSEAVAGMREVERLRSEDLAAAEAPEATAIPELEEDATTRKIENLRGYLRRIRGDGGRE